MLGRLVVLLLLMVPSAALAQPGVSREHAIKAAYLYNFGKYVQWPAASFPKENAPLVIGVVGPSQVSGHLAKFAAAGKLVQGRPLSVATWAAAKDIKQCHILFVSSDLDPQEHAAVLKSVEAKPILLVSEADVGGVRFLVQANKMKVQIALKKVQARKLTVSSKLLQVAEVVN